MSYSSEVLADAPWAFWNDLIVSTSAQPQDASGNGNAFTWDNPAPRSVPLVPGGGYSSGSAGGGAVASRALIPSLSGASVTVDGWVYVGGSGAAGAFFCIGNGANGWALGIGSGTFASPGLNLILLNGGVAWIPTSYNFTAGLHHVMVTRSATSVFKIYVDGNATPVYTSAALSVPTPTAGMAVGGTVATTTNAMTPDLLIDNIGFYASELAASRATAHYNGGSGGDAPVLADAPVVYLKLDDDGPGMRDISANGRSLGFNGTKPTSATGPSANAEALSWSTATGYAVGPISQQPTTVTYECWVKFAAAPSNITTLVTVGGSGSSGNTSAVSLTPTGAIEFGLYPGVSSPITTAPLAVNTWHHVVCSVGAAGAKVRVNKSTLVSSGTTAVSSVARGAFFVRNGGLNGYQNTGAVQVAAPAMWRSQLTDARTDAHYDAMFAAAGTTIVGDAWSAAATWLDGQALTAITVTGDAWATPATWLDGSAVAAVPITVAGDSWSSPAGWLNGNAVVGGVTANIVIAGEAWTVPAVWLAASGVNESDLTFESDGYDYTGASSVTWEPAAATPPMGAFPTATPPNRVHHALGTPTFDNGRPLFTFGSETIAPWVDYLRVTVGGKDVTWFRNVQTIIGGWQNLDPYGDASASLSFPQVSEFEAFGTGELSWLRKTAPVVINRVVDGVVIDSDDPLFDGFISRDPVDSGPAQVSVEGQFMGRQSRLMHQPNPLHDFQADAGWHAYRTMSLPGSTFGLVPYRGPHTGINIRSRGDRSMTRLGYFDHLLGLAIEESGDSWTLLPDRSVGRNVMRMQKRSMATVHATVCAGAHGVKVRDFASDLAENRLYGEGQDPEGGRWRNLVYPSAGYDDDAPDYPLAGGAAFGRGTTDADTVGGAGISLLSRRMWVLGLLDASGAPPVISSVFDADVEEGINEFRRRLGLTQNGMVTTSLWANLYNQGFNKQRLADAHFEPIAADPRTVQYLTGPGGAAVAGNPVFDRKVMPVEGFRTYGENVRKLEARRHGRAEINRTEVRTGTIVLTSDPAEMSRFELRAGMTLLVKNLLGTGAAGLKLYISSVEVDWSGQSVTLAVATSALHFIELATIRQRQVEARQNPAKRARQLFRRSSQVADSVIGWESEGPSGVVPRKRIQAGQWNEIQVVAAERGTLAEMRYVTEDPTRFMVMVMGQRVPKRLLNRKIGDPFDWRGTGDDKQNTFQFHAEWLQRHLMSQAYGDPDEPGGYWPRHHTNEAGKVTTHPVTGILKDDASQPFVTTACFLWVYVWPKADAWFHGRLKLVPED